MARFDLSLRRRAMDRIISLFRNLVDKATQDFIDNKISLLDWHLLMQEYIKRENAMMVFAGTGADSPSSVRPEEWLVLGNEIKKQMQFLVGFVRDVAADLVSADQMLSRAQMYVESAGASFWRSVAPVDLPAHPKDGSAPCLTKDQCHWEFEDVKDAAGRVVAILAYWVLGEAEHCDVCVERSQTWNPLRVNLP